jgi:RNA polymerase sigma-32 factor
VDPACLTFSESPVQSLIEKEETARLRMALAEGLECLDPRERRIAQAHYLSEPPMTLSALGEQFGISRERVRQLAERVRRKLRVRLLQQGFNAA